MSQAVRTKFLISRYLSIYRRKLVEMPMTSILMKCPLYTCFSDELSNDLFFLNFDLFHELCTTKRIDIQAEWIFCFQKAAIQKQNAGPKITIISPTIFESMWCKVSDSCCDHSFAVNSRNTHRNAQTKLNYLTWDW